MIHMKPDRAIQEGSCRGFVPVFARDTWHKRDGKCQNQTSARLWSDLDGVLNGTYGDLPVRAVAVDTGGHHTKMAYEFCRTRLARRIWAIKGRGSPSIPVWPRRPTRTNKAKIPLFIVGVDAVKDAVYARLKLTQPGPGSIHFPRRLDVDYFRQLTAERVVTRFEKGRPIRSWQPKREGERNEALDTFVYAHAALHGLISMGNATE